jgi:serine/threonine protein kinase
MTDRVPRATANGLHAGDLVVGQRLGEYRIDVVHAARGHGHQYDATHAVLPRRATIKVAPPGVPQGLSIDLLREACLLETLDHPGVPRMFECGILDALRVSGRRPWIAFELVEGPSLATSNLSLRGLLDVMRDVAAILDRVHVRGIIHHAVIPEAIVLAARRRFPVCLVDWSHARANDSLAPPPALAKTQYAAPERRAGRGAHASADVYSLGVIVHERLAWVPADERPPLLEAMLADMLAEDPRRRPTAAHARDHAAWLAAQIAGDDVDEIVLSGPITSEITPEISGELVRPEHRIRE